MLIYKVLPLYKYHIISKLYKYSYSYTLILTLDSVRVCLSLDECVNDSASAISSIYTFAKKRR